MTPQTPPTDRPLTAGDVPLLREGDVLRVVDPHPNTHAIGDLVTVVRTIPVSPTDEWIRIVWDGNEVDQYPHRFTFVARPATSAASEGWQAMIDRVVPEIAPMDAIEASEFCCEQTLLLDRTRIRRELAALASPPVSERERELEAMITVSAALDLAKACLGPSVAASRLATWAPAKAATDYIEEAQSAAKHRIEALTAGEA